MLYHVCVCVCGYVRVTVFLLMSGILHTSTSTSAYIIRGTLNIVYNRQYHHRHSHNALSLCVCMCLSQVICMEDCVWVEQANEANKWVNEWMNDYTLLTNLRCQLRWWRRRSTKRRPSFTSFELRVECLPLHLLTMPFMNGVHCFEWTIVAFLNTFIS